MKVVERRIQVAVPGKWDEAMALETRWEEADAPFGPPPKRRLRSLTGPYSFDTYVWEREWNSLAAMEAHYMKQIEATTDHSLEVETDQVWAHSTVEYYWLLD